MTITSESVRQNFGLLLPKEIEFLKDLAIRLPENPTVVNIGAGRGTSGLAFLEARRDMRLITCDINDDMQLNGGLESERMEFKAAGYPLSSQNWAQVQGSSIIIGRSWAFEQVDMVFVDGDHSYDGAYGDISTWIPHIKEDGVMAIHDYKRSSIDYELYESQGMKGITNIRRDEEGVDNAVHDYFYKRDKAHHEIGVADSVIAFRVRR